MQVADSFFVGRVGWAEQLLFSVQTIERANREFRHPSLIQAEVIEQSVVWDAVDNVVSIKADFYTIPQLLVNRPTMAKRVRAYTPTRAIDVGIDRDLITTFCGIPIQPDLMADKNIDTLEERTAYLLYAKLVHDDLVAEWNLFADIQENLWLKIYRDEGLLEFSANELHPGALNHFTLLAGFAGTGLYSGIPERAGFIRGVSRASYQAAITQWLIDSGTTARSSGVAVDNDSYINWLADQLSTISANTAAVAKKSIDPRYVYRFNPIVPLPPIISGEDNGTTGTPDIGAPDPANNESPGKTLLEQLANQEQPLTAELGGGLNTAPINTLPEC
jgi:hypothetical protein